MEMTSANKMVILLNTIIKPFFEIMYFKDNEYLDSAYIELEETQLENGVFVNEQTIVEELKNHIISTKKEVDFLINSKDIFKATNVYPLIAKGKYLPIYKEDIKNSFPGSKESHFTFVEIYKNKLENIIYTHFIPNKYKSMAIRICRQLGLRLGKFDIYPSFIQNCLKKVMPENYVYIYHNKYIISVLASYGGLLSSYITLENDIDKVSSVLFAMIGKHKYELEKVNIEEVFTNIVNVEQEPYNYKLKTFNFDLGAIKSR